MFNNRYFENKKIVIIGLARSGVACANLLHKLKAAVSITDNVDNLQTQEACTKLSSHKISVELGKHSPGLIKQADLVVVSPGVRLDAEPVKWAKEFNKPVISEIEVASLLCPAPIIAVTGSNGKTTVTTLIGKILTEAQKKVFVCGNIGNPFCGEVENIKEDDFVVLEASSFQLETIRDFKPKIAVILNVTANHFDRYNNMQEYLDAKKRIFMNQDKDDSLILNKDDPLLKDIAAEAKSKVIFFTRENGLNPNQSTVFSVGKILGINKEVILKVFDEFKGIQHRMEEVCNISGIKFINDSKATTADSAIWAIENINQPVVLIAGGKHKGIDYRVILQAAKTKVKHAVLIGEAKEIIAADIGEQIPVEKALNLKEAVDKAFSLAKPGYCVLFSPMCSSFDMFKDYEDRGRIFKKIVLELKAKESSHG